jgi:hypothetical protein
VVGWGAVRVIDLDTRILPFGDRVGDLLCLDRTFETFAAQQLDNSGVAPARATRADYAFASAPIWSAFAAKARGPSALAVPVGSPLAKYLAVSGARRDGDRFVLDLFLDAPDGDLDTVRSACVPVEVDVDVTLRRRELIRVGPPPHHIDLVDDGVLAMHVEHWVHVLWLWPALVRRLQKRPTKNVIGDNVQIHPSARVEGSVIGDDVQIGASCSIEGSFIGAGCQLSDFTKCRYAVLGRDTHTLADASFSEMVALGGGTLTNLGFADSVLGHDVFLTTGVIFWNEQLDGTVFVDHGGASVDTGRKELGGCAGHGSVLGARTILAPGRGLPNRTTVVMRKEESVFAIHDAPPGTPMIWHEGAMVPVADVAPDYVPEEIAEELA